MIWLWSLAFAGEVTLWHAWRGEERQALDTLVGTWNEEHPEIPVQAVFVPHETLGAKAEAAIPHGNGPDLLIFGHDRVGQWVKSSIILPVSPQASFLPVSTAALSIQGQTYGWPLACKSLALFRNLALAPEAPTTTDELASTARKLTQGAQFGIAYEFASAYQTAPWMHGFGGGVFDETGAVALDRPANVAAFSFAQSLFALGPADPTGALVTQLFNAGKVAFTVNGPWFLGEIAPGVEFAVSPLPVVNQTGLAAAPYVTVEALLLARDNPEARAFGDWFTAAPAATIRQDIGKQLVATEGVEGQDPVIGAFRTQLQSAVAMPTTAAMPQTWEPLAHALRRLVRGAATAEQAASEAQTEYRIISRPAPPAVNPTPWLAALGLGVLGGAVLAVRAARRTRWRPWRYVLPWLFPAFFAMTLLVVVPFLVGASVAFFETDGREFTFVGIAHFLDILLARDFPLSSPLSFWSTLVVTVVWTLANVTLHAGIGVALALLLREPWVRMRGVFRALLVLPWAVPSYITALIWKGLFHRQFGAFNAILVAFGGEPVSWFGSFATAFAANVATNTWLGFPFMMVVTLGALQAIPRDLEEAAEVDGAGALDRFWHVTLPLLKPALLPAIILGSVWTFNQFNVIYLVSAGEPDGSTDILVSQAYRWAFSRGHRYGYAAAYAMLIFGVLVMYGRAANRLAGKKVV